MKKAKTHRSRSAPSNQPNIADMFAKRYDVLGAEQGNINSSFTSEHL